jgi:hypothetical protein
MAVTAVTGFHCVVANRAQMYPADHGIPVYLYRRLSTIKTSYRALPRRKIIVPRISTVKSLNFRADCQWLFLLWQTAVHQMHRILMRECTIVKPVRGGLFRPNCTSMVSVGHTLSWRYTFKSDYNAGVGLSKVRCSVGEERVEARIGTRDYVRQGYIRVRYIRQGKVRISFWSAT